MATLPQYTHHKEGYGKHATEQLDLAKSLLPGILDALGGIKTSDGTTFTVCDYGAADGTSSVPVIEACREYLNKGRGKHCELCWVFNDIPNNDFNRIFLNSKGTIAKHFQRVDTIFFMASAKSFYKQVMPKESIDFGLCLAAVHWLSEGIHECMANSGESQLQLRKEVGREDWMSFLLSRAQELKPGGQLFVTVAADKNLDEGHHWTSPMFLAIQYLYDSKLITQEEFQVMTVPRFVFRNEEDIREPFEAISEYIATKAGLRLVKIERYNHDISLFTEWQQAGGAKNEAATETAIMKMVRFMKTFSHTYLCILSETRGKEEEDTILQAFYRETENIIRRDITILQPFVPNMTVQIGKVLTK